MTEEKESMMALIFIVRVSFMRRCVKQLNLTIKDHYSNFKEGASASRGKQN